MQVVLDVRPSRAVDYTSETDVQKPIRSVARAGVKFYKLTSIVIAGDLKRLSDLFDERCARHVKKRIGDVSALDVYAAKRVTDDLEALLLEVDKGDLAGIAEWPRSKGFEVFPEPLGSGSDGRIRIHLQLVDNRYRDVFRALCRDVCLVLVATVGGVEAIRFFHKRLVRWQSFLQKHGPEGLSEQARCGLFGELLVLRDMLLPCIAAGTVLPAWRGCKKAHQDFQFAYSTLEVKTTRAVIPDLISVSNIQQLDAKGIKYMFLTVVNVHENETAGETLPGMVDSLRAALPDDSRDLLDQGLEEVGYSDAHRDIYSRTHYQQLTLLHFEVRDGFPRLTRDQVPEGVKSVRYDLSVDSCRPFRTDEVALLGRIAEDRDDVGSE